MAQPRKLHHTQATKLDAIGHSCEWDQEMGHFFGTPKGDKRGFKFTAPEAKAFVALAALNTMLFNEYPNLGVWFDSARDVFVLEYFGNENPETHFLFTSEVPELAEVLEAADECELDLGEDDTQDLEPTVVSAKYKAIYAERGNPNHCGDWLAGWLEGRLVREGFKDHVKKDGSMSQRKAKYFDIHAFQALLDNNKVDMSGKWAQSRTKGWQGRFRMNGRQLLEIQIVATGGLLIDEEGNEVEVDEQWLASKTLQHHKHAPQEG